MKTIGLVGGISPQSTLTYYKCINDAVNRRLKKHHSAKIVMVSLDFEAIASNIFKNDWGSVKQLMLEACLILEQASVDFIAFCSNTLYKVSNTVALHLSTPLVHILDPVIQLTQFSGYQKVGLLGTHYTMSGFFHRAYLCSRLPGLECLVPSLSLQTEINRIIFEELCLGYITDSAFTTLEQAATELKHQGAEAIILGCTELQMVFSESKVGVPLLDTTTLHAEYLANLACPNIYMYSAKPTERKEEKALQEISKLS